MMIDVVYKGVKLVVEYDHYESERRTLEYPGCAEGVEIVCVLTRHGDDITELMADEHWEPLTDCVFEAHRDKYADEY
jgi:hypothetical protein